MVVLPTEYQGSRLYDPDKKLKVTDFTMGGQLRITHRDKEQLYLDKQWFDRGTIKWIAFYGDCEHEVLPVTAGHRITLTYQLYVSENIGGLVQPQLETPDSKASPMYWCIKNILASPMFMKDGGILGFHCAYQYPETFEGTYYYERYPLVLKGIDAVLFTIFRVLRFCVHIKPTKDMITITRELVDAKIRFQDILSSDGDLTAVTHYLKFEF